MDSEKLKRVARMCLAGDCVKLQNCIDSGILSDEELFYCDGLFAFYAVRESGDHVDVLKLLFKHCQSFREQKLHGLLSVAGRIGNIKCVKFLLSHGADPKPLRDTTSYDNHREIRNLF
jgi:ankyrin repeat protein